MAKSEPGIPDMGEYGDYRRLSIGDIVPMILQQHKAKRAGLHSDLRIGDKDGYLSWAVRKGLSEPGKKHLAIQQPLHSEEGARFEGEIKKGRGTGTVKKAYEGKALVTNVDADGVTFVTATGRYPERFRLQRTDGDKWLLINVTPTEKPEFKKIHYTKVPQEDIEKLFRPDIMLEAKVDGSAEWLQVLKDRLESVSYRVSKKS